MVLTLLSQPEYTIDMPGFAGYRCTASSPNSLALPSAVEYATERQCVLQSAREAIAFRIAARRADNANDYQLTRTAALYFTKDDKHYVAFDNSPDPAENILLA